jgi:hypothetical protein
MSTGLQFYNSTGALLGVVGRIEIVEARQKQMIGHHHDLNIFQRLRHREKISYIISPILHNCLYIRSTLYEQ